MTEEHLDPLLVRIKDCFKEAKKHQEAWREEALENYDFVAGRQWSEEDKAKLREQNRPEITFNRMGPYFDAISGSEINNRQEIAYLPRTTGDSAKDEKLTQVVKWVLDQTNAEDEESEAFMDLLITGIGGIETRMDYDDEPDGLIRMERIDPLELYWDPSAKKRNLVDARWLIRAQWKTKEEIKALWPDAEIDLAKELWDDEPQNEINDASKDFLYEKNATGYDQKTGKYRVIHYLYYDHEDVYRVADNQTGRVATLTPERFELANKLLKFDSREYVKQKKKVYKYAFALGDEVLEKGEIPCQAFNIKIITGKRDRNTNLWYGPARVMKDPQRWANKFLSQMLHIINSNAKGGLIAEVGAFEDPKKAEEAWADPSAVVLLKNGGLGRVQERQFATYPSGLDKLLQFAIGSIPDVTGINLEMMGMADRQQAGILEQERKKAAYVILAGLFNSLKAYRVEQGKLLFKYIKDYINDGRIIRITTDQGQQGVPLQLQGEDLQYDIVVDQAASSPNLKEQTWATLSQILPQLIKMGVPLPPELLDYSPLPTGLAEAWKRQLSGQLPPQVQQQMQQMTQELQKLQEENFALKQQAQIKAAQIQSKHVLGTQKNQIEAANAAQNMQAQLIKIQKDYDAKVAKLQADVVTTVENLKKDFIVAAKDDVKSQKEAELIDAQIQKTLAEANALAPNTTLLQAIEENAQRLHQELQTSVDSIRTEVNEKISKPRKKTIKLQRDAKGKPIGAEVIEQ